MLSQKPVSGRLFKAIVRDRRAFQTRGKIGRRKLRKGSLPMDDFRAVTGWKVQVSLSGTTLQAEAATGRNMIMSVDRWDGPCRRGLVPANRKSHVPAVRPRCT